MARGHWELGAALAAKRRMETKSSHNEAKLSAEVRALSADLVAAEQRLRESEAAAQRKIEVLALGIPTHSSRLIRASTRAPGALPVMKADGGSHVRISSWQVLGATAGQMAANNAEALDNEKRAAANTVREVGFARCCLPTNTRRECCCY